MKKKYTKSVFIFRRDLRLEDNRGLTQALQQSTSVIPCFIFDPDQVETHNSYRSLNAIQFMIASLRELNRQLHKKRGRLFLFYGNPEKIITNLIKNEQIEAIFTNRDYTPFSIARDERIKKACLNNNSIFSQYADLLLHEPEEIKNSNGTPYSIFTSFYRKALKIPVAKPQLKIKGAFYNKSIKNAKGIALFKKVLPHYHNKKIYAQGGAFHAHILLKNIKKQNNYAKTHDFPALETSHLSAHLKFGTLSIRQTYWTIHEKLGASHPLLRQLFWRDFFTHVAYHSPFVFGQPFHKKYKKLPWKNNLKKFKAWCAGLTGIPIVDAGMRQLNETGFMHNRVRMIVGSFLVKDLHIDWQWGERYFAQNLIDYDPSVNNGNWQWVASTGCDAQPYFRIFNPWLQQKKFDPHCEYIKQWVPELHAVDSKIIHTWNHSQYYSHKNYPKPIVNHDIESKITKQIYKSMTL